MVSLSSIGALREIATQTSLGALRRQQSCSSARKATARAIRTASACWLVRCQYLWTVLRFLDRAPERPGLISLFCVGPQQPPLCPWPGTVLSCFEPLHQGQDRASAGTAGKAAPIACKISLLP